MDGRPRVRAADRDGPAHLRLMGVADERVHAGVREGVRVRPSGWFVPRVESLHRRADVHIVAALRPTPGDRAPDRNGHGRRADAAAYATALGAGTPPSASELAPIHGTYAPKIVPANFVATIDNRYLPFKPGTAFHYRGVRGTTPQRDDEVVTHQHKKILGVSCTV